MKIQRISRIFCSSFFAFFLLVVVVMIAFPKTRTIEAFFSGVIFCTALFFINLFMYFLLQKRTITKHLIIILTIVFSVIDQIIKTVLIFVLKDSSISIVKNLIRIDLVENPYQTIIFQAADKIVSPYIAGSLKLFIPVLFILILHFYKKRYNISFDSSYAKIGIAFILSASICTIFDSFVWKYTPDYILMVPLYSAIDLKDIFAFYGVGFLIPEFMINQTSKIR